MATLKAFTDDNLHELVLQMEESTVEKGKKCCLAAFFLFQQYFQMAFCLGVIW